MLCHGRMAFHCKVSLKQGRQCFVMAEWHSIASSKCDPQVDGNWTGNESNNLGQQKREVDFKILSTAPGGLGSCHTHVSPPSSQAPLWKCGMLCCFTLSHRTTTGKVLATTVMVTSGIWILSVKSRTPAPGKDVSYNRGGHIGHMDFVCQKQDPCPGERC